MEVGGIGATTIQGITIPIERPTTIHGTTIPIERPITWSTTTGSTDITSRLRSIGRRGSIITTGYRDSCTRTITGRDRALAWVSLVPEVESTSASRLSPNRSLSGWKSISPPK